ncbi:MAG: DUF4296 domain-containing protein [Cyclobacteriaceae bacterium]|nr:DUF4296 domain-containing protein [Cyclobacteriaceae bacterium]
MKKLFLTVCVALLLSCTSQDDRPPAGLYDTQQIAAFLKDLYILEMKVKELRLTDDSTKKVFAYYEQELFAKHNMSDSIYRESFKYYMDDIKGLSKIYEIIADSLSLEERIETIKDTTENEAEQE